LAKNPENYKAQFRKGKAQGEQGYVEKSIATLEDLLTKDTESTYLVFSSLTTLYYFGTPIRTHTRLLHFSRIINSLSNKFCLDQASIKAEIASIKAKDKEREKKHNQKFKGFLNKKPQLVDPTLLVDSNPSTPSGSSSTSVGTDISDASTVSVESVESAGTVPGG
jgi:FK506-binding protein 8